jgi:hypothetical protein
VTTIWSSISAWQQKYISAQPGEWSNKQLGSSSSVQAAWISHLNLNLIGLPRSLHQKPMTYSPSCSLIACNATTFSPTLRPLHSQSWIALFDSIQAAQAIQSFERAWRHTEVALTLINWGGQGKHAWHRSWWAKFLGPRHVKASSGKS